MKRVLFYGGASLLSNIWSRYWKENHVVYLGLNKRWIEIEGTTSIQMSENLEDLENVIKNYKIDIIINCAGLTSVEECEIKSEKAYYLNGYLPGELARITNELDVKFVQISTDHLGSGKNRMNKEQIRPNPLNIYAKSKLIGEDNVLINNPNALIIRTNFFGNGPSYRASFSDTIISSLRNNKKIFLFNNVYYTPIHVFELANNIINLINLDASGIFNISSNERITKFDFGILIAKKFNFNRSLINSIPIEEKNLVIRPKDMSLSNFKVKDFLNIEIKPLSIQLDYIL